MREKEIVLEFFGLIVTSFLRGISLVILGLLAIWIVRKGPDMRNSAFREDIKGRAGGIMLIIIGIFVIVTKIIEMLK
jgi:hypothetical protein